MAGAQYFNFDEKIFEAICLRVANGETLAEIAKDCGFSRAGFYKFRNADSKRVDAYARAREDQAESWADQILADAADDSKDTIDTDEGPKQNSEWIARSRLKVDARKWLMARLHPKMWGDKVEQTLRGDADAPVVFSISIDRVNDAEKEAGFEE